MKAMTGKERLTAALRGEKVDRVPICLRGFPVGEKLPGDEHFTKAWKSYPEHRKLFEEKEQYIDPIKMWHLTRADFQPYSEMDFTGRHALIDPKLVDFNVEQVSKDEKRYIGKVKTAKGILTYQSKVLRNEHQAWRIEHIAKSLDDIISLVELPWSFDVNDVNFENYHKTYNPIKNRGVTALFFTDPIITLSGCIDFQDFLMIAFQERKIVHELLEEMTRRTLIFIDEVFQNNTLDTIAVLGGSEQIRPPMLSDELFDEFIVPYSGQVVKRLKEYDLLVHCHCHGRVKTIIKKFIDMGYDSIDPIEPPSQGDATYEEIREIVGDEITLVGNIECV